MNEKVDEIRRYMMYVLFQNVLRTWYARDPLILKTEDRLVELAWLAATSVKEGIVAAFLSVFLGFFLKFNFNII